MSIWITDRARRHLKAEAAKAGQTMGDFVTGLLQKHGGFVPLPAVSGSSKVDAAGGRQLQSVEYQQSEKDHDRPDSNAHVNTPPGYRW